MQETLTSARERFDLRWRERARRAGRALMAAAVAAVRGRASAASAQEDRSEIFAKKTHHRLYRQYCGRKLRPVRAIGRAFLGKFIPEIRPSSSRTCRALAAPGQLHVQRGAKGRHGVGHRRRDRRDRAGACEQLRAVRRAQLHVDRQARGERRHPHDVAYVQGSIAARTPRRFRRCLPGRAREVSRRRFRPLLNALMKPNSRSCAAIPLRTKRCLPWNAAKWRASPQI